MKQLKPISRFRGWLAGWALGVGYSDPSWAASAGMYGPSGETDLPTPAQSVGIDGIYQSINLLSDPICSQPMQVRQLNPEGGTHIVSGTDVSRALSAWPLIDREKFLFDTLVNGNGFAIVRRNGRGGCDHLETVGCHRVTVAVDEASQVWYELSEDTELNLPAETIAARDMCHLKYRAHANHTAVGQSPLITLAPSIDGVRVVKEGGRWLFKNLPLPAVVLSTPNRLGKDAGQRLKDQWLDNNSGSGQGKAVVLDNDLKPVVMSRSTATDYQVSELDSVSTRSLSRVFGIPAALLGESSATAYNSSVELIRSFHSLTLKPFAKRIGDCLSQVLLDAEQRSGGMYISVEMASLIRGEGGELADYLSKLTNSGVLTVNESRQMVGLEDQSGGDMLRSPVNVMPIDTWQDYEPGSTKDQPAPSSADQKPETGKAMARLMAASVNPLPRVSERRSVKKLLNIIAGA